MQYISTFWKQTFSFLLALTAWQTANAQCSFTGLDSIYCSNDEPVTLEADPGGETFSGPGMTGTTFDPALAGPGTHTITYETAGTGGGGDGDAYYMKSNIGNPWGSTTNNAEMDVAFGPGGWTLEAFETADPAIVFAPTTGFVFMDGSDGQATELNTFLIANLVIIEEWVEAGGRLLLNSAPNEGTDMEFGFDGTLLDYTPGPSYVDMGEIVDLTHPAYLGPELPTDFVLDGNWFGHALIEGTGLTTLMVDNIDASKVVLAEKCWSAGRVMFGGMTTTNWHDPDPHASNWRANLFTYMYNTGCEAIDPCTYTQEVTVVALPDVTLDADDYELCEGDGVTFTAGGADSYAFNVETVEDGIEYFPTDLGPIEYIVTGTDVASGCTNNDTVVVTLNENPTVVANVDVPTICLGESFTFEGAGADIYEWDMGVLDGVPFTPAAAGPLTITVTGTDATTGCTNTDAVDVIVYNNPTVTANTTAPNICDGETFTLTGGGADTYVWDMGVTDGVAFTPPGFGPVTYTVIGENTLSGCTNTATIEVTMHELPTVTASVTEIEICDGETITFNGGGADVYTWDMGVINGVPFVPTTLGTTTYTVTGEATDFGCTNTATIDVTVHEIPDVSANASDSEVCLGSSTVLTGSGADSYVWDGGIVNGIPFTPGGLGSAVYNVVGTTVEGCSADASITITTIDCEIVEAGFLYDDNLCLGECLTLTDTSLGVTLTTWEWDFGGAVEPNTSTLQSPTICFDSLGTFDVSLTITSLYGKVSTETKTISVNPIPTVEAEYDTIIVLGNYANIYATASTTGEYLWEPSEHVDCPTCGVTTASPYDSTMYTVTFTDENGCQADDQVMVLVNFVEDVGVPTAFSPNGDGFNDILYVKGSGLASVNLVVYNRYGEIVFESDDQEIGWDGTFMNRDENPGVFTWVLQYTFFNEKRGMQKGNTTLIR